MKASERRTHLNRIILDLADYRRGANKLDHALAANQPGLRSPRFDAGTASANAKPDDLPEELRGRDTHADPTGDLVARGDVALNAERRVDELLERIHRDASELAGITKRWTTTATDKPTTPDDDGCEVVARVTGAGGGAAWEPIHVISSVGGLLDRQHRLGRWAYDFIRTSGRLPTRQEITAHVAGKRVRRKAS